MIILIILLMSGVGLIIKSIINVRNLGQQLLVVDTISDWSTNSNSPIEGFVNIGPRLYGEMKSHRVPLSQINVKGQLCDCFRESMDITHSIVMVGPHKEICIRLKYDMRLDKYHIVGYVGAIE
jgi:hypothetical protein